MIAMNNSLLFLIRSTLFAALLCTPTSLCSAKRDRSLGHPHRGSLTPYTPGPFSLSLEKADEKELASGKSVMKQIPDESGAGLGGKAICVQDIGAPKSAVWNQILDMNSYVGKVGKLKECRNYFSKKNEDGSSTIKTKMVIGVIPGYKYEYYCDHLYRPDRDSLIWSLDYDKYSDFDDVAGHWHVEDHPTKKGSTRLFYACDLKFHGKVPGPVMNILTKQALRTATAWVKRESESEPTREIPAEYATAPAF
eukprot:CAMPEP_0195518150 /NCGR_PEP_ID=MMETSP0794_2-20130614/12377_1 /TAXON_ID=515487 /ORGANISM="Stephanopyxis turris, Strain CCMP 815" /LENGTH=250 /DNA_ID=CAMNT_0040647069 /DNA_START=102 /DNA_END=854 /DNA_ORIENTATION=+